MLDEIFDNGERLLGKVKWVKEYLCKNAENLEDVKEIVEDLENYDEDTIVVVNYSHPMGCYELEWHWNYGDKIWY